MVVTLQSPLMPAVNDVFQSHCYALCHPLSVHLPELAAAHSSDGGLSCTVMQGEPTWKESCWVAGWGVGDGQSEFIRVQFMEFNRVPEGFMNNHGYYHGE